MYKTSHNNTSSSNLKQAQELLLMSLADGEAGVWKRIRAKRLLKTNSEARNYFSQIQQLDKELSAASSMIAEVNRIDLWERIEARLDQEQHNELLLGRRKFEEVSALSKSTRVFEILGSIPKLGWGLGGGLVGGLAAACVTIMLVSKPVVDHTQIASNTSDSRKLAQLNPTLELVSAENSASTTNYEEMLPAGATPHPIERLEPTAIEVDWMRSDGRVRMMHEPNDRAAIIWVTRRSQNNSPVIRLRRSVPQAVLSVRNSEVPRVQRVPQAVPAYSTGE